MNDARLVLGHSIRFSEGSIGNGLENQTFETMDSQNCLAAKQLQNIDWTAFWRWLWGDGVDDGASHRR